MKLLNIISISNWKGILLTLLLSLTLFSLVHSNKLTENENSLTKTTLQEEEKITEVVETDKKHKKKLKMKKKSRATSLTSAETKNDSIKNSTYRSLNVTFVKQDMADFKNAHRKWDYKIIDKQLEDIFATMLHKENFKTVFSDRAYMEIFLNSFHNCDKNFDNVLDFAEFKTCMSNDTYLAVITPPPKVFAAFDNYTDADFFYNKIFTVMDSLGANALNFHAYMELRLMIFSWKKCSVVAPFIEESSWECAIEIVSGFKTSSRTTLRNTFYMCLELSNSANRIRNIDFISFLMFASSARLYGRINGKMDHDVTLNEFNLVLDENMLPDRYNQFIVSNFFKLTAEIDHPNDGIDFQSFVYYDFALRLFYNANSTIRWQLNSGEFVNVLSNMHFPSAVFNELTLIPSTNFTSSSYQMYTYMNISNFQDEQDYLLKFVEKNENKVDTVAKKSKLRTRSRSLERQVPNAPYFNLASNSSFFLNFTASRIFNLIDENSDGQITWYDFGSFFQISYIFAKNDPQKKGKLVAGDIYEKFSTWSDFPRVSATLRQRSARFNLISQDNYVDLFTALVVLKIDDIVVLYTRRTEKSALYEVELKRIFNKANLNNLNEGVLNNCLRGVDSMNIPKYDWECAFIAGLQLNINYLESASSYYTAKANNITLYNTVFYNVDPALLPPKAAPAFF